MTIFITSYKLEILDVYADSYCVLKKVRKKAIKSPLRAIQISVFELNLK